MKIPDHRLPWLFYCWQLAAIMWCGNWPTLSFAVLVVAGVSHSRWLISDEQMRRRLPLLLGLPIGIVCFVVSTESLVSVSTGFLLLAQVLTVLQLTARWACRQDITAALGVLSVLMSVLSMRGGLLDFQYQLIALATVLPALWYSNRARTESMLNVQGERRRLSAAPYLLLVAACMPPLVLFLNATAPAAQQFVIGVVEERIGNWQAGRGFVRVATLDSVTRAKMLNPRAVALRVFADREPGYLRGRAFEEFNGWNWEIPTQRGSRLEVTAVTPTRGVINETEHLKGAQSFALDRSAERVTHHFDVENDPLRGPMFFVSLEAAYIEGYGRTVEVDEHKIVRSGLDHQSRYRVLVRSKANIDILDEEKRTRLLYTPVSVEGLRMQAERLTQDAESSLQKMRLIEDFFHEYFLYADEPVDVNSPRGISPIVPFVRDRQPGHCEYFATAAAMMLRMVDVPTRLVVGYSVKELNDDQEYYVARNRNAHAWVEAYDDQAQVWRIVEPTPGYVSQSDLGRVDLASVGGRRESRGGNSAEQEYGLLAALRYLQIWISGAVGVALMVAASVVLLLIGYLVLRRHTQRHRSKTGLVFELGPEALGCQGELKRWVRWLRTHGYERAPEESWWGFSERIAAASQWRASQEGTAMDPRLSQAVNWLRHYSVLRYSGR